MVTVDTHCHASPYWFEPIEILLNEMDRNDVDKAVLVQFRGLYDNSYMIESVRRYPGRFSAVVMVDTDRPDAPETLERWVQQGAEGVRLNAVGRSPGDDPVAIWRKAAELGIPVSMHGSLEEYSSSGIEDIIKEFQNLNFLIEHLGWGGIDTSPSRTNYRKVLGLARYGNTLMKVPGLGEICQRPMPFRQPFPFEGNVPALIEMAIDAFGPSRLMWGSDFPPVSQREGYRNALRWPMEHVAFRSEDDKEWVFGKTAMSLWKFGQT